jgi:aminoglycoside 6-adenylyltransferase
MRSEEEMIKLILDEARSDERIRAVVMNGSRADPRARHDPFQDFDIVYLVTDVAPFRRNLEWIRRFGEIMILQTPDDRNDPHPESHPGYTYLMQFMDGNRIDLCIHPIDRQSERTRDSLTLVLLDKDGTLGPLPPPDDRDYLPRPPTERQFEDCCNEFWWLGPYVAKGLWRRQTIYPRFVLDQLMRNEMHKMLGWYVGWKTEHTKSLGGFGKYMERYLGPELWDQYRQTYADADLENTWRALFAMGDLFRTVGRATAGHHGFPYPQADDERVSAHLRRVHDLPPNATELP